jgi:hypothetical protein
MPVASSRLRGDSGPRFRRGPTAPRVARSPGHRVAWLMASATSAALRVGKAAVQARLGPARYRWRDVAGVEAFLGDARFPSGRDIGAAP